MKNSKGSERLGEKHLEGPTRTRPCRVQRAGPRIPEGGPVRIAGGYVRAAVEPVRAAAELV